MEFFNDNPKTDAWGNQQQDSFGNTIYNNNDGNGDYTKDAWGNKDYRD